MAETNFCGERSKDGVGEPEFAAIAKDPTLTTAEALRQAMLGTMSDSANPDWANPSEWAPFVLVGEGGVIAR